MTLPRTFYATAASVRSFYSALQRNLQERPAVQSVAVATDLPPTTNEMRAFTPEGAGAEVPSTTNLSWVDGPYFEVLGITLKQGRFFTPDEHLQDRRVVVVNEKLAALAWPGEPAVGKRLRWGAAGSTAPWLTVVGVIGNVADGPIGAEPGVHAYEPFRQLPDAFLNGTPNQFGRDLQAVVRGDGDLRALAALVRQEIAALDPALAIERVQPMTDRVGEVVAPRRFGTLLVAAAAAVALCLACVGLAGLLAYTIGQRRKEIAVRMALGADAGRVLRMVLTQGARLVGVGLAAGLAGSLLVTRLIASFLYQTSPYDPVTLAAVIGLLAGVAMGACALPAWRAARLDPVVALRADP
jgi:putative ABC transport system permease protein